VEDIRRRVRVINRECGVPYIVGYSVDGHTGSSTAIFQKRRRTMVGLSALHEKIRKTD
jgi:hypothetical protein